MQNAAQRDPWQINDPPPTTLVIAWPHEDPPSRAEILAAAHDAAGGLVDRGELENTREDLLWSAAIEVPTLPATILIMGDRGGEFPEDVRGEGPAIHPRWAVVMQTMLAHDDVVGDYARLLRLAMDSVPDAPAILDIQSLRAFTRQELEWLLPADDVEPPAECLWTIHMVADERHVERGCWMHTHGLWRCGRPELEILEVPKELSSAAGELINLVAERSLDEPLPAPGQPWALGSGTAIALQPWQECVNYMASGSSGGRSDREGAAAEAHAGVRAVLCAERPRGVFRKVWIRPEEVLRAIRSGQAVMVRSPRASARTAHLARATWPEFAMAVADARRASTTAPIHLLVKAGFPLREEHARTKQDDHDDGWREHMWLEIDRCEGDRARGRLLNQPQFIKGVKQGDMMWIDRADVSDWSVMTPLGRFEPGRRGGLRDAISHLIAQDAAKSQ